MSTLSLPQVAPSSLVRTAQPPVSSASAEERVLARAGSLEVVLASRPATLEAALRLRHEVFAVEMGAHLNSVQGIDRDLFDTWCQHLVLRDTTGGEVVGTYRVLMPAQARRLGRLYTEQEFWLTRLDPIRDEIAELGRSCIARPWRGGAALMLLWSAIGELLADSGLRYVLGCVSVGLEDGGLIAARLSRQLEAQHLAPEQFRVWPRDRLPVEDLLSQAGEAECPQHAPIPTLLKGYLRAGARLLGDAHRDLDFGCADFPMMLDLQTLDARYQRRFMS